MGKIVASYIVRVTLHEREDIELDKWKGDNPADGDAGPEPTIDEITDIVETALYDQLPYFSHEAINATAERTDA